MAKNKTGKTPTWATMAGRPDGKSLPPKSKGAKMEVTRFELWSNGSKVGAWDARKNKMASRQAITAISKLPEGSYYRLIQYNKWGDRNERSEEIRWGFK